MPSSRHVRKNKYRKETRERHKPFGGPPKQKKGFLRHQVPTERRDKTTVAGCPNNNPYLLGCGAGVRHGESTRKIGDASDFSMGQGGSAIP